MPTCMCVIAHANVCEKELRVSAYTCLIAQAEVSERELREPTHTCVIAQAEISEKELRELMIKTQKDQIQVSLAPSSASVCLLVCIFV